MRCGNEISASSGTCERDRKSQILLSTPGICAAENEIFDFNINSTIGRNNFIIRGHLEV